MRAILKKGSASLCPHVAQKLDPSHHRSQGSSSLQELNPSELDGSFFSQERLWLKFLWDLLHEVHGVQRNKHEPPLKKCTKYNAVVMVSLGERKKRISLSLRPLVPMPPATTLGEKSCLFRVASLLSPLRRSSFANALKFQLISSLYWFDKSHF